MVYVDPKNLGFDPFWERWCNSRSVKQEKEELDKLFRKYVHPAVGYTIEGFVDGRAVEKLKTIIPLTNLNLVSVRTDEKGVTRSNEFVCKGILLNKILCKGSSLVSCCRKPLLSAQSR